VGGYPLREHGRGCLPRGGLRAAHPPPVTDLGTLLDLARAGLAVAIVPSLGGPAEDGSLALRPVAGGGLGRRLFAATRRGAAERPALAALVAALRERLSGT
jgi:DNA-binding transcriptional LysR family regulator